MTLSLKKAHVQYDTSGEIEETIVSFSKNTRIINYLKVDIIRFCIVMVSLKIPRVEYSRLGS